MNKFLTVKINTLKPEKEVIMRAAAILEEGGLVVAPTETRYGLLARADREDAVRKLMRLKNRPDTVPIAVFVRSVDDMARYGKLTGSARTLASVFLPGPMTLVLEATSNWAPPIVVAGKTGFRFSSSLVIQALVNAVGLPLTATSANRHDQPEPVTAAELAASLGTEVDLYLDAGILDRPTSTVVDCTGTETRVLREGSITKDEIGKVLKKRVSHG